MAARVKLTDMRERVPSALNHMRAQILQMKSLSKHIIFFTRAFVCLFVCLFVGVCVCYLVGCLMGCLSVCRGVCYIVCLCLFCMGAV